MGKHVNAGSSTLVGLVVAALASMAMVAIASPAQAADATSVRAAGADRYSTAVDTAQKAPGDSFTAPGGDVVLATGERFPDALAGSALAGAVDAPILLTQQDRLPMPTADFLTAKQPDVVHILGGTAAVSQGVEDTVLALVPGVTVTRYAGADRYETAWQIADVIDSTTGVAGVPAANASSVIFLSTGEDFPDALGAGPQAFTGPHPVVLTRANALSPAAAQAISALAPDLVIVLGGPAAVAPTVEDAVKALGVDTLRVQGPDRYATAAALADTLVSLGELDPANVGLATGQKFPDALAAAPYLGTAAAPLLLVNSIPATTRGFLDANAGQIQTVHAFGGTAVVDDATLDDAVALASGRVVDLQLLGINDYHGHLQADTPGSVDGERAGGAEFLSAKLDELRAGQANSLTVAAGDLIGGTPAFSSLFHDEPSVESLNVMELDVSGVGNHEFDEGVDELLRMQNGGCHPVDGCYFPSEPYAGADFPWLAANVQSETTGDTVLPPYEIKTVDGIDVAFIGMTLEGTPTLVAKSGIAGWEFLDEVETANALVPEITAAGAEAIVVLLHEGAQQNPPPGDINACVDVSGPVLAIADGLDPEIDAVITGHTHQPYNCVLPDPDGQPRLLTSAYSFGRVVTEMTLALDSVTGDVRRGLSTATNHAVLQKDLTADPDQTAVIAKWQPLFDEVGNEPVGEITADIVRGGNPPGDDRGVESSAGNLVADAQLAATQDLFGAQIALMNPGGVRSDLLFASSPAGEGDGVVTFGEALTFQPFNNTLFSFPLTGAQVLSVLEEQCQPPGSSRPFLHLGVSDGLTYDLSTEFDPTTGDCISVKVANVELDGAALDESATYVVTANAFLADGGDNFTTFAEVPPEAKLDGGLDLTALTDYLEANSPVDPPGTDRVNELP